MKPTLFRIPVPGCGMLSTMARPRGDDWIDEEMAGLRAAGVDVLVSVQTDEERRELGLMEEGVAAQRAGIRFHAFPIVDFGVPDRALLLPLLDVLIGDLTAGRHVVVHCRAGIGRSSLVAAALLVGLGDTVAQAWAGIAEARGCPVPETDEQRMWLDLYGDHLRPV